MNKDEIRSFLEEQESIGNSLINTRQWAVGKADKWFKEEFEDKLEWGELYELNQEGIEDSSIMTWMLKDQYNTVFWDKVDEFEQELLEYKNYEYDT